MRIILNHIFFFRYTRNGLLHMLDRNRRIKPHPEKFQTTSEQFNIIITCEERVYDQVIESIFLKLPLPTTCNY